jgi:hypothetical protein
MAQVLLYHVLARGECTLMSFLGDRRDPVKQLLLPLGIVAIGCGASLLPHHLIVEAAQLLAAWLTLSLPIGVVVGHCVLDEAEHP